MRSSSLLLHVARVLAITVVAGAVAPQLQAQGNLSTQGFGYAPGQLSTRALGTGGSIAELDPLSPLNPASIALHQTKILEFQIEPEFRTLNSPTGSEHTTIARYPNILAAFPVGKGWVISAGASTLLDRTSTTEFNTTQFIGGQDTVPMHTTYRIDGAMSDLRLAAAYNVKPWLRIGFGLHGVTGHNLVSITQTFTDSVQFASFNQELVLDFTGLAGSAGFQATSKSWGLGVSGRLGGDIRAQVEDTVLSRAKVPSRFGATLAYTGIANSAFSIRTSWDGWSSLKGLGSGDATPVDAWDSGIGADIAGPHIGQKIVYLRAGLRTRTLPYEARGLDDVEHKVTENSGSAGFGTTFANGRVITDFAAIYANRSAGLPATEHAWTLSFGLSLRP
ncbi:MAG TPA: hypothetical protein VGM82_18610 [Gemmatimonadaceae bacterium]|jgi:hypothetical protein